MKWFYLVILLLFIVPSCQNIPATVTLSTSASATSTVELSTPTGTPIPPVTITLTPTVIPTATTSPERLEERAGALCDAAYSAPVQSKQISLPYLGMMKTERDQVPAWRIGNSIPHLFALSEESVRSIVCRLETKTQVGSYTDGSAAFRVTLNIRILSWPDGTVVFSKTVESGPPPETKVGFGGGYGSYPEGSNINEWFIEQFEHSNFLYVPQENIYSISFSPIGGSAVLGMSHDVDNTAEQLPSRIVVVDLQNLQTVTEWEVDTSVLYDLAYSPDGRVILSGGNDSRIYFWDAQTGEMLGRTALSSSPQLIQYSPDGELIGVLTTSDMYLIDSTSMQVSASYPAMGTTFSFSPDSRVIYTDGSGFEVTTGNTVFQFYDPVDLSPTIAPDGTVSFGTQDSINGFSLSPDGTYGVSFSASPDEDTGITEHVYYLSVWDMKAQKRLSRIRFVGSPFFDILGFSPNGGQLAINNGNEIWLLDTVTWQVTRILAGHTNPILDLDFSPDGTTIISASSDKTVRVWALGD